MKDIAVLTNINARIIEYWMVRFAIKRRSRSESVYVKNNRGKAVFAFSDDIGTDSIFSLGLGLGLFWGEGMKLNSNGVRLGNSDPDLILFFKKFLKEIFQVPEEKFKYYLQIFNDHNPDDIVDFWANKLGVDRAKIGKPSIVTLQRGGSYKRKSAFGVLQIGVFNTKLKRLFDSALLYLKENPNAVVAQLVEHIHGEAQSLSPTSCESGK